MSSRDLVQTISSEWEGGKDVSTPGQLFTPLRILAVVAGAGCYYAFLQLGKPWYKVPEFVFDVFVFLE